MAINNTKIEGEFTVFRDFKIEFGEGINLLIGANGVGKTQLLKLLYVGAASQKNHIEQNMPDERMQKIIPKSIVQNTAASIFDVDIEYLRNNFINTSFHSSYDNEIFPPTVFIPAKEMLSHAKGLPSMKKKYGVNMPFDATLLDIIEKAQAWRLKEIPEFAKSIVSPLEKVMGGSVEVKDDGSFWMRKENNDLIPFSLEAEGLKKLGLLWQLLVNESITPNSVVLWDEPEASINPEAIPVLVEAMIEMQRNGIQIIATTHSYSFAKYFDVLRKSKDNINYYCLYKSENGFTQYTQASSFSELSPNPIDDAGERLHNDTIRKAMEAL